MARVIFMTAFYSVLTVIAATLLAALWRSRRALRAGRSGDIRWHSDFHDLSGRDRACRHVLTGEFRSRECPNAFDCRECQTHARLVAHRPPPPVAEPGGEIFGMPFPPDRFYHRGHTWARPEPDGTVLVGLDELGRRLIGPPDAVELPLPGVSIRANSAAFHLRRGNARVRVLSPVDGEVVATGGPHLDWYLKVKPAGGPADLRHLLRGSEVKPWLAAEMERLQLALSTEGAPTLADGGVPVADIAGACPEIDWDAVCGQMFLQP